jgi:hypothetical protein
VTPTRPEQPNDHPSINPDWKKKAEAFFAGEMPPIERDAFERELAHNPEMARDVYTAMGMGPVFHEAVMAFRIRHLESHARIADRSVTKQVPWWGRTRSRLVLTVVVAALVFLVVFVSNIGEPPLVEPPTAPPTVEGFRGISPVGEIPALPVQFTWTAHPDASQYRFEIVDQSSQPAYSTLTAGNSLIVAVDELAERGFREGNWRVIPVDDHGAELDASTPVDIRIGSR